MERKEDLVEKNIPEPNTSSTISSSIDKCTPKEKPRAMISGSCHRSVGPLASTPTPFSDSKKLISKKHELNNDIILIEDQIRGSGAVEIESGNMADDYVCPKDEIVIKEELLSSEEEDHSAPVSASTESPLQKLPKQEEEEEVTLICCEECESWFSLESLNIDEVPEGDWFCESCTVNKLKSTRPKRNASRKTKEKAETVEKKRKTKSESTEENSKTLRPGSQTVARRSTRKNKSDVTVASTSTTATRRSTRSTSARSTRSSK